MCSNEQKGWNEMECLLSGTISVKAVLEEQKRPIQELIVNPQKRTKEIGYIIALAKKQGIPVSFSTKEEMQHLAPNNGGVLLKVKAKEELPLLNPNHVFEGLCVYVSGVEDPYNLGSIARTLYAAGANLMIVQQRDWSSALPILMRASAGAWERLEIVAISQDEQLIEAAKKQNQPIICAARDESAQPLFEATLPRNLLLAIGGAMRGLSSRLLLASQDHLYIPYGRPFRNALDSVSAAAVFAFAWTAVYGKENGERSF